MDIKVGNLSVLSTGTVVSSKSEPIYFQIDKDTAIDVSFLTSPDREPQVRFKLSDDSTRLIVQIFNFTSQVGTGTSEPILVGSIDTEKHRKRKLFLTFMVHTHSQENANQTRVFNYTWLTQDFD